MNKVLLTLSLVVFPILLASTLLGRETAGDYKALNAEYQTALAQYAKAYNAAPAKEKRALRAQHPGPAFWPRFEELGRESGRATLWLIANSKHSGLKADGLADFKRGAYDRVFGMKNNAAYLVAAVSALGADARSVGTEFVESHLRGLLKGDCSRQAKGVTTAKLGELLSSSKDEERAAEGKKMLEKYVAEYISKGAMAIDFDGTTIDGHEFKLSDYKGKAVLVDFYGFW